MTVVVNSPELATFIARRANITVMMPGGRVRSRTLAVVDDWALTILCQIHVDVAFMATNGVSIEREAGDARRPDHRTPDECRQLVERALAAENAAQARDVVINA